MGRTDTEPSFKRGVGTAVMGGPRGDFRDAVALAFEDFILKHGRLPNMDNLLFSGCFTSAGVLFEIAEEV